VAAILLGMSSTLAWAAPPASVADEAMRSVRAYADAMIERGRDTYGKEHSPLFAAAMDRKTLQVFEKMPPRLPDMRNSDRTYNGANPMHDLNLCQVLYALGEITGQARYAQEADAALKWFFEHCQSPKGLMAWGEHQGWSFLDDAPSAPQGPHEFYRPWVLWDRCWKLAPEACHRFALGVWEHQVGDPKTGRFSRHAMDIWDKDKRSGRTGYEFPRHGGFYIATWAADYEHPKDPVMLRAIESLVDGFQGRRHPATGAIPAQTSLPDLMWPQSNLSLAVDLWDAAARLPEPLAGKMRACARQIDEVFLKIKHEPGPGGRGFVKACHTSTLEPGDARAEKAGGTKDLRWRPYTETWATGYGVSVHAQIAMLCLLRHRQIDEPRYKDLFLATADSYLTADPPLKPFKNEEGKTVEPLVYPGALGEAVALQTAAYRMTGQTKYLDRADQFAALALKTYFTPDSPLPRVGSLPKHNWYEALTRADTLAMTLLDLWAAHNRRDLKTELQWTDR